MKPLSPSEKESLSRFLAAEQANAEEPANQALLALFAALPPVEPKLDFAARVMAGIEASPPMRALPKAWRRKLGGDLPPRLRLPLAAALVSAALGTLYLLPAFVLLLVRVEPTQVLAGSAGLFAAAFERLAAWRWIYQLLEQLGSAIFDVVGTPPVLLASFASVAFATLLFRWLWHLLEPARRSSHATYS